MSDAEKVEMCADCRFFKYAFEDGHAFAEVGECKRYPPVSSPFWESQCHKDTGRKEVRAISAEFPMVGDQDWCGEFQCK